MSQRNSVSVMVWKELHAAIRDILAKYKVAVGDFFSLAVLILVLKAPEVLAWYLMSAYEWDRETAENFVFELKERLEGMLDSILEEAEELVKEAVVASA